MKTTAQFILTALLIVPAVTAGCSGSGPPADAARKLVAPAGPYLGQTPPGKVPEVFAPGLASTAAFELNSAFAPGGGELYQTLVVSGWGFSAIIRRSIEAGAWSELEVATFSGRYNDIDPNLSPDGNEIFFISRRPATDGETGLSPAWDIWMAGRDGRGSPWSEARRLPEPVNSPAAELYPSVSAGGTLYFGSNRKGGLGEFDIYRAEREGGSWGRAVNLGPPVNSEYSESDAFIAPDESFIIVTVTGRPDSRGKNDLYVSFRQDGGSWGELHHLDDSINTPAKEYCPVLSPDGRYFFFTRGRDDTRSLHSDKRRSFRELAELTYTWRNDLENIHWVDASVLERSNFE